MQTLIQLIETRWSKRSRGQPAATARNAVPELCDFPSNLPADPVLLLPVCYVEADQFVQPRISPPIAWSSSLSEQWRMAIYEHEAGIRLDFNGTPGSDSTGRALKSFILPAQHWLQIVVNRRIRTEYSWEYRKFVYNVFYGQAKRARELTRTQPPCYRWRQENHLR